MQSNPEQRQYLKLPIAVWAVGIIGRFGYHFFYCVALSRAPAIVLLLQY